MDPILEKKWRKFKSHRRAFVSLFLVSIVFLLSLISEALCNDSPLIVHHNGHFYFPILKFYPPSTFGDMDDTTLDYKFFRTSGTFNKPGNWMLFPIVPYGVNESANDLPGPPPTRPSKKHWLGTDDRGRDLLTRLVYGFRNSMLFALVSWALIVFLAYTLGALQGYLGGRVDFYGQRVIEVWNALPVIYVIIFLLSVFPPSLVLLTIVWVLFSWIGLASYVRAEVLRVRKMDYIAAARALGANTGRILFKHTLPNAFGPILTFSPFIISASIGSLAALDYLGLGLPPPAASWGELLHQGKENLTSWWLVFFPFFFLFATLLLLNFIGEGARTSFEAKA